jgi:hypothetical protein
MRWCLAVVLAACSDKLPDPPSASAFAAMTDEQKCDATAPRATRCVRELAIALVRQVAGDNEAARAERDQAERPSPGPAERRKLHEHHCYGRNTTAYTQAVVACWDAADCAAFASCVFAAAR